MLAAIAPCLDGPEGARSLCVDPGIFDILRRTSNKGSIAGPMLRVSRAEIILIYGRAVAAQGPEARNSLRLLPMPPATRLSIGPTLWQHCQSSARCLAKVLVGML